MLRTFIFDDSKSHWLEEESNLLSHDICVVLDEEKGILYIWRGPKSSKNRFKRGYKQLKGVIPNFPDLDLQVMLTKKDFPFEIQTKLKAMLETTIQERSTTLLFSRFITIRIYFVFLLVTIVFPIISLLNLSSSLTWKTSNGNVEVENQIFQMWVNISQILILVTIISFFISLVIGITEVENQVIIFSIIGLLICVGIYFYLDFGIYLFLFQEGSTVDNFIILRRDIIIFISLNALLILFFESLNIYELISFLKTYRNFIF
ncbi:MAG: hypothetical protein ACW986_15480 [Promethearchaeota archaeon]|jgi:hypothetical protein